MDILSILNAIVIGGSVVLVGLSVWLVIRLNKCWIVITLAAIVILFIQVSSIL